MNRKLFGIYERGYAILAAVVLIAMIFSQLLMGFSLQRFLINLGPNDLMLFAAPFLIAVAILVFRLMSRGAPRPLRTILRVARRERYWVIRAVFVFFCFFIFTQSFVGIKPRIPSINPFYADPMLADIDRLLFFGVDPWRITHTIIGPLGTVIIDRIYTLFFVFVGLSVIVMVTAKDHAFQLRSLFTCFLIWFGLGVVLAIVLSSVGPVFYEQFYNDDRFSPLVAELRTVDQTRPLSMIYIADWLREQSDPATFGSGISAMPSLHIAHTFFFFLMVREMTTSPMPRILMAGFVGAMWIGSVHLAWHYALDGLVSIIFVSLFWVLSGKLVRWCRTTDPSDEDLTEHSV